ncbi:hypothetical protein [Pseudomonas sp. R5(2019)]|uniref:hypothetical protein n=1 Tax=Pseudomonas sp. R5(2019) TaxID=2697566 RepID=UPI001411C18E|nr:hypothetical protein [Pseudomonas sp. R5(2019)]NBA97901.1 hypothetical protein [Pseudomonas sp. R5(2019)]
MTLSINSTIALLQQKIDAAAKDGVYSYLEFEQFRDDADKQLARAKDPSADESLFKLQAAADAAVEALERLATDSRKNKSSPLEKSALKTAVEWQLAYVVACYLSRVYHL